MSGSRREEPGQIRDTIRRVLERNRLAVLATQRKGQPHASLIAYTPLEGLRFLAFATYRKTLKYQSIEEDPRVAILIEDREGGDRDSDPHLVLTAFGTAVRTPEKERHVHISAHLARHPKLESFLSSPDCEFVLVAIHAYQLVTGIDHARWYPVEQLLAT